MLKTYDKPQNNYQNSFLFDMESWGFYNIIQRKITRELIAIIKIISDNSIDTISSISKEFVKKLVKGSLNKFLFKNKNKAVNNGRKIGSKNSNSKLSS